MVFQAVVFTLRHVKPTAQSEMRAMTISLVPGTVVVRRRRRRRRR